MAEPSCGKCQRVEQVLAGWPMALPASDGGAIFQGMAAAPPANGGALAPGGSVAFAGAVD
jgi:hypothetical protein